MKSVGTPILSASSKKSSHDSGRRDRITSPLSGSRRMYTSEPSKRYSTGSRTAWLRPFRNILAVRGMVYIVVYTIEACQALQSSALKALVFRETRPGPQLLSCDLSDNIRQRADIVNRDANLVAER